MKINSMDLKTIRYLIEQEIENDRLDGKKGNPYLKSLSNKIRDMLQEMEI